MNTRRAFITVLVIAFVQFAIIAVLGWFVFKKDISQIPDAENSGFQMFLKEKELLEYQNMEFTFVEEQSMDEMEQRLANSLFGNAANPNLNETFIWWEELPDIDSIHEFENLYSISVPTVDIETDSIIVSFNRKICNLRFSESDRFSKVNNKIACITFSRESYENVAFFYSVKRIWGNETTYIFVPSHIMSPCYIISEEEKYLGTTLPIRCPK